MPHPRHVVCATLEEAPAGGRRGFGYPCVVKAPDRQGQKGLVLVPRRVGARGRVRRSRSASRAASVVLVEELVPGPRGDGERVLGRRPVHAADRHRPRRRRAACVRRRARARLAELAARPSRSAAAVDAARAAAEALGVARGADLHAGRGRRARRARRRARRAARRRSRRGALRGGARRRPERARARGRARRAGRRRAARAARARRAAPCVRFLVPEPGELEQVAGRRGGRGGRRASSGCASTASRARCSARCAAAPTAPARCSPSATRARRRSRALAARPTAYASSLSMPPKLSSRRRDLPRLPAARGRRRGDRGGRRDDPLGLADDRADARRSSSGASPSTSARSTRSPSRPGRRRCTSRSSRSGSGPGDEVITTPITWPATANVIVHTGATPGLRRRSRRRPEHRPGRASPSSSRRGRRRSCPSTSYGQPADLDPLWALGLPVVEDAAHAVESEYRGRKIGGLSDATCFSLYATKNVAAGEGGIVATNRDDVAEARARPDASCAAATARSTTSPCPGYKANLSDVLAAIALCQLDKVERHRELRMRAVRALRRGRRRARRDRAASPATRATRTRTTSTSSGSTPSAPARRATSTSDALADENIGTSIHFLPVHRLTRLPRALSRPAAAAGRRARRRRGALAAALAGALGARTSRTRSTRSAACTRAFTRDEAPPDPRRRDARRHRPLHRLHPLEDRPRQDGRHPPRRRPRLLLRARSRSWSSPSGRWPGAGSSCSPAAGSTTASRWLTRAYFTAYTAGQVLPTSIGGDAMRIFETTRRHPGQRRADRRLGAARARARRRGDARARGDRVRARDRAATTSAPTSGSSSPSCVATVVLGVVLFSRRMRRPLALDRAAAAPAARRAAAARRLRGDPRATADHPWLLVGVCALTLAIQAVRVLAIWLAGEGGRRRPLAARLLRDGAAALPRHARARSRSTGSPCARRSSSASSASSASAPTRRSRPASSSSSSRSRSRCPGR